jgi:SAM-dependent methyltransferase
VSELSAYYRSSDAYAALLAGQDDAVFGAYLRRFRQWVARGSRVVDAGCGVGTSTRMLRAAGFSALGTDLSEHFLPAEEGFAVVDFENATLPDDAFDAAGTMNVIEHVPQPRRFLDEMVRVVRPGGYLIIVSPNLTSPLVAVRILADLIARRTPYLGVRSPVAAIALLARNLVRSVQAAAGHDAFSRRAPTLDSGIVGYDVDAVYWTNAAEVRRHLERRGCTTVEYQTEGRGRVARLLARRLPSFAGQMVIVARVG